MSDRCLSVLFLLLATFVSLAQPAIKPDTQNPDTLKAGPPKIRIPLSAFIVSAGLISYGAIALNNHPLQSIDHSIREAVWEDNPHRVFPLDDYLQYTPAATVYLLNAVGIKGRNNFRDRTIIYLMANVLMGVAVEGLKKTISAERPDGSGTDGFPSGHTSTAFVSAEFLRQEYKDVSPWYGVGGYAAAIGTSFLRVYNDKHWFSELLPGAGIGILSTKVAYWAYPYIQRKLFKHHPTNLVAMPYYQSGTAGVSINYCFH